jgi:YggT family protein
MLTQALIFLLETFMGLFALALLVRFYMQLLRAPARNPLTAFLVALTNWLVVPRVASSPECGVWIFRPWCWPGSPRCCCSA